MGAAPSKEKTVDESNNQIKALVKDCEALLSKEKAIPEMLRILELIEKKKEREERKLANDRLFLIGKFDDLLPFFLSFLTGSVLCGILLFFVVRHTLKVEKFQVMLEYYLSKLLSLLTN